MQAPALQVTRGCPQLRSRRGGHLQRTRAKQKNAPHVRLYFSEPLLSKKLSEKVPDISQCAIIPTVPSYWYN